MKHIHALLASFLLPIAAHAVVYEDTLPNPLQFGGNNLAEGPFVSTFVVPDAATWDIGTITLSIGQGSEADMFLTITDPGANILGTSGTTQLTQLFEFIPTSFSFINAVTLSAGIYNIVSNYTITGLDNSSYWDAGANAYRIESGTAAIPEPSTTAAVTGAAILAVVALRRRRV